MIFWVLERKLEEDFSGEGLFRERCRERLGKQERRQSRRKEEQNQSWKQRGSWSREGSKEEAGGVGDFFRGYGNTVAMVDSDQFITKDATLIN